MSGSRRAIRPVEAGLLCALAFGVSTLAREDWGAVSAGSMTVARSGHTATLLHDGRVLIVGGCTSSAGTCMTKSAEIYDPGTGTFRETGSMAVARLNHKATLLDDGSVLITGGMTATAEDRVRLVTVASAEVFDPVTERFSAAGSMAAPRAQYTATRLPDGKVLIAGGIGPGDAPALATELYDPSTRTFSRGASMSDARSEHTATLLSDGRVLLAGGTGGSPGRRVTLHTVEVYANGTFSSLPSLTIGRGAHTATLLSGSRILFAGGYKVGENPPPYQVCLASAELYDARAGSISVLKMGAARCVHSAAQVSTGDVLLIGGSGLSSVTRFDVSKGTLVESGPMSVNRAGAGVAVLAGDTVLITGGTLQTTLAELYRNAPGPSNR
jgi:hypothetical protein